MSSTVMDFGYLKSSRFRTVSRGYNAAISKIEERFSDGWAPLPSLCQLTALAATHGNRVSVRQRAEIEFCHFRVDEPYKSGHASFSVIYSFSIRAEITVDVTSVFNRFERYLTTRLYKACLGEMALLRFADGARFQAEFRWTHGLGWEYLTVWGKKAEYRLSLSGERCPYPAAN